MSEQQLIIPFVAEDLDPGMGSSVWVRLEPVAAIGDVATVADAAQLIDKLFDIEPCTGGLGTGGEETPLNEAGAVDPPVEEQEFADTVQATTSIGVCAAAAADWSWQARVKVLRSHPDRPYVLRIDQGEVISTVRVDEVIETSLLFEEANSAQLTMPIVGAATIRWGSVVTRSGVEPTWRVSGATVNLDRRATGQLNLRYRTVYDLVTVRVSGRPDTEQLQQAECLCFYQRLVATATLEPPEVDDRDLARLQCRSGGSLGDTSDGQCYETVTTQTLCSCSGEVWSEHTAEVGIECPGGATPGRHFMGSRTITGGYTWCPGERDDSLYDPEYQRSVCCREITPVLPCVSQTTGLPASRGIEHGLDHYLSLYGPNTRMVALSPQEGLCGELVMELRRISRDCCGMAIPVSLPGELVAAPNSEFLVEAVNGVEPLRWTTEGGGISVEGIVGARGALFRTTADFCGSSMITVTDDCNTAATMPVRSTNGGWAERVVDGCSGLPGFSSGPADDDGPTDLCGDFTLPNVRTNGAWRVLVSYGSSGGSTCPPPQANCPGQYITLLRGLGMAPEQALCERYSCQLETTANYGGGCCTVRSGGGDPGYISFYQTMGGAFEWVC